MNYKNMDSMFKLSKPDEKKLGITSQIGLVKEEDKNKDTSDEEMEENYLWEERDLKEGDNLLGFELNNLFEGRKLQKSPTKADLLDPMEQQPGLGKKKMGSEELRIEEQTEESRKEKVQDLLQQLSQYAKDQNILELIGSQQFSEDQKKVIKDFNKHKRRQSIDSASSENLSMISNEDIHSLSPARVDKDSRPLSRKIYSKEGRSDSSDSSERDDDRRTERLRRSRERSRPKKKRKIKHSSSSSSSSRASPVKASKQVKAKKISQKSPEIKEKNLELTDKANKGSPDSAAKDSLLKHGDQVRDKELSLAPSVNSNALSAPKEPEAQSSKAQDYLATFEMFRFKGKETTFFSPGDDQESDDDEEEEEEDEKEALQGKDNQTRILPSGGLKFPGTKVPVGPPPGIIRPPPGIIRPPPGGVGPPAKTMASVGPPSKSIVPVGPPGVPSQITKPQSITAQVAKVSDFTGL